MSFNKSELFKEARTMSSWEKIDSGIHDWVCEKITLENTQKSNKPAIMYYGKIKNSKGVYQGCKLVDNIDTEDNFKFGICRLIQFCEHVGINTGDIVDEVDLVNRANTEAVGRIVKIEWIAKSINGRLIKEKQFRF